MRTLNLCIPRIFPVEFNFSMIFCERSVLYRCCTLGWGVGARGILALALGGSGMRGPKVIVLGVVYFLLQFDRLRYHCSREVIAFYA